MKVFIVGLNHKTATVDIREKLAFNHDQTQQMLGKLKEDFADVEFVLISTCNRVEVYCGYDQQSGIRSEMIVERLAAYKNISTESFQSLVYVHYDDEAVRHLLEVASSLDSMVLGDAQINAQVKESYHVACEANATGKVLNRLFHCAFSASKDVYTLTSISCRRVSVAGVAVNLAKQLFADLTKAKVTVIGAGDMGELLIKHLLDDHCRDITVCNRTLQRAEGIASKYDISVGPWEQLNHCLEKTDIVVAAATTDDYLFDGIFCRDLMQKRRSRAILVIDIAVPRNFDPQANELDDFYLYSVDDLEQVIQTNIEARQADRDQADRIISQAVSDFMDWLDMMDIGPLLGKLKENFHAISKVELQAYLDAHPNMPEMAKQQAEKLVYRLVNKQLHYLFGHINNLARDKNITDVTRLVNQIVEHTDDSLI